MTREPKETITMAHAIPTDVSDGGHVVGTLYGSSRHDEQGRLVLGLGLSEQSGYREFDVVVGDKFTIGGATWQVTKIFEPFVPPEGPEFAGFTGGGGSVAELTRVSEPGD